MADRTASPLEQALIAMDRRRLSPGAFYQRLLASEIFVPTLLDDDQDDGEEAYVTTAPEAFSLMVMNIDDREVVPVFEDFDRLRLWADETGSAVGYIGIDADVLLSIIDPKLSIALFAGGEGFYLFDPETLRHLKDTKAETPANRPDDEIRVDLPGALPDGLVEVLAPVLRAQDGNVVEARIVALSGPPDGFRPVLGGENEGDEGGARLTVALTLRENSDDLFNRVAAELAEAATNLLGAHEIVHFMNLTDTELGDQMTKTLPPFFAWPDGTIH
jgi:type III secretion system (T3SS) SseB-like protein